MPKRFACLNPRSVVDGTSCADGNTLNWLAQSDGAWSQGVLAQLPMHRARRPSTRHSICCAT